MDDDELPGMLALQKAVAEGKWPHTVDARIWADEFIKQFPSGGYDTGDLIGWFANAIMAGFDTATLRHSAAIHHAAPVEWTTTKPNKPGWYWWKEPQSGTAYPILVGFIVVKLHQRLVAWMAYNSSDYFEVEHVAGEWSDKPLVPPGDAHE